VDNDIQIREILKYDEHLRDCTGRDIPVEVAAAIWIRKYARLWRTSHPAAGSAS
jgi:hypothetical protein